jgi:hypothetical protein
MTIRKVNLRSFKEIIYSFIRLIVSSERQSKIAESKFFFKHRTRSLPGHLNFKLQNDI